LYFEFRNPQSKIRNRGPLSLNLRPAARRLMPVEHINLLKPDVKSRY